MTEQRYRRKSSALKKFARKVTQLKKKELVQRIKKLSNDLEV
jgi:hypothetical protein